MDALQYSDHPEAGAVMEAALADPFYAVRGKALQSLDQSSLSEKGLMQVREMAQSDPHSAVRAEALYYLEAAEDEKAAALAKDALKAEPYPVVAAGLEVLAVLDPDACLEAIEELKSEDNTQIVVAIGKIYTENGGDNALSYFEDHLQDVGGYAAFDFYDGYQQLLAGEEIVVANKGIERLQSIAMNMGESPWQRIASTKALSDLRKTYQRKVRSESDAAAKEKLEAQAGKLRVIIDLIKETETNEQVKGIYQQF